MAGNKISTKARKDEKSKANKIQNSEESEDMDFSILRKPIQTSITSFAQARKIFDLATEELKGLIANECDILYECKVCRNIFRSLANFISHKRVYCKEEFKSSLHGNFFKVSSTESEMVKLKKLEEKYFESLKSKEEMETMDVDEIDNRIPLTKDLTAIVEKIVSVNCLNDKNSEDTLVLQKVPNSNVAVYQNYDSKDEKLDRMKKQVKELDEILSKNKAVLQSDGKFKIQSSLPCESDNVIQISDDEDDSIQYLNCQMCDHEFSTMKTLKYHMKYKHVESRLVYPCPDCLEIFSTSWSVYRHLFKVHRKTAAQIKRLRESVQTKAFRMNNPPAYYEKRKNVKPPAVQKISDEDRLDQENQAWMDNVEGDGDVPRCFGCGRTFERRAALAAHTHTCQPRSRALARRPPETKKIEIQIRKDYNKGTAPTISLPPKPTDSNENKTSIEDLATTKDSAKPSEEDSAKPSEEDSAKPSEEDSAKPSEEEIPGDVVEENEKPTITLEKTKDENALPPNSITPTKLPFSQQTEKNNLTIFRQRIQPDIEVNTLLCKKCEIKHDTVQELYHHMADHYKWFRYACKLCNFKHYEFEKLPEHVKIVHKLRGDSDFYFSTVKAIDGNEALELAESVVDIVDTNHTSPESRRPSRCSSDSSRISDDSSSSSTRVEAGSRKRKLCQNKAPTKKKREALIHDDEEDQKNTDGEKETMDQDTSRSKTFEENSSDMDDIDDKISKRSVTGPSTTVPLRRPVRKKTKLKNADFEYDLSNLLKMEAQGYRESQTTASKTNQNKKKPSQDNTSYYEILNRDCNGALATLTKEAVVNSTAHFKNLPFIINSGHKDSKPSTMFVRPMLPKVSSKVDKNSPKKELIEESTDSSSLQNEICTTVDQINSEEIPTTSNNVVPNDTPKTLENEIDSLEKTESSQVEPLVTTTNNTVKKSINIPAVVPIKFRRQSLEALKNNPLINKNINDFNKAGMKTKILVIKPIHRKQDGSNSASKGPLKFQTIKLKDPSKTSVTKLEKESDQVVVVKVPKVECVSSRVANDIHTVPQTVNSANVIKGEIEEPLSNNHHPPTINLNNNEVEKNPTDTEIDKNSDDN